MKYLCIHAADASSQNLWVNTPALLLPFPQILWIWISQAAVSHEAQFQHPGAVSPGRDSSVHTRVVWRVFVTALEGKNVLNQTGWHLFSLMVIFSEILSNWFSHNSNYIHKYTHSLSSDLWPLPCTPYNCLNCCLLHIIWNICTVWAAARGFVLLLMLNPDSQSMILCHRISDHLYTSCSTCSNVGRNADRRFYSGFTFSEP